MTGNENFLRFTLSMIDLSNPELERSASLAVTAVAALFFAVLITLILPPPDRP